MTLTDALALMEQGLKLQGDGLALIEEGARRQKQAGNELGLILLEHTPHCPVPSCGKLMALKQARCNGGTAVRSFWSCPSWEKHKKDGAKCSVSYETWLKGVAQKLSPTPEGKG
jgi:hypothetical protein